MRQKIEYARSVLVPDKRWDKSTALTEVAHTQGVIDALRWLETNHSRVALNMRHVRS